MILSFCAVTSMNSFSVIWQLIPLDLGAPTASLLMEKHKPLRSSQSVDQPPAPQGLSWVQLGEGFEFFFLRMFRGLPALPDLLFSRGVSVPQLGGWIYRLGDSSRRKMASQFPAPQTDAGWRKPAELPLLDHERAKHYGPPTFAHVKMHPTKNGL